MAFITIKVRRGTAAAWTAANTLLVDGEMGWETDAKKLKIGDGVTPWNSLPYFTGNVTSIVGITGTKAQFDAAVTDGNILYVGDVTQYTDEMARDAIGAALTAGTGIDVTPNDGSDTITIAIDTTEEAQRRADPSYATVLRDEFLIGEGESGEIGDLGWRFTNFGMAGLAAVAGHPGILVVTSNATIGSVNFMSWRKTTGAVEHFLNEVDEMYWVFRQAATGNDADQRLGFHRGPDGTTSDGLYLEKLAADTNWQFVGRASSAQNRQDTGVAADTTNWMKARLRREADADWRCSINGGSEVAVTANISALGLGPFLQMVPTTANARALHVDFFSLRLKALAR